MDQSDSKKCTKCGEIKRLDEFHRSRNKRDGHVSWCRGCKAADHVRRSGVSQAERDAKAQRRRIEHCCTECRTTKPITEFYTSGKDVSSRCKICIRETAKADSARRRADNPELYRERQRQWRSANPERVIANRRRYEAAHPEHAAKQVQSALQWAAANPDRESANRAAKRLRRRLRMKATIEVVDLQILWTGACAICNESIDPNLRWPDPRSKSIDHIVPLSKGGTHTQDNLQYACLGCNVAKGARTA